MVSFVHDFILILVELLQVQFRENFLNIQIHVVELNENFLEIKLILKDVRDMLNGFDLLFQLRFALAYFQPLADPF